jgi:hypothetical protein
VTRRLVVLVLALAIWTGVALVPNTFLFVRLCAIGGVVVPVGPPPSGPAPTLTPEQRANLTVRCGGFQYDVFTAVLLGVGYVTIVGFAVSRWRSST